GAPLAAGVDADLSDDVDGSAAPAQHHRVVAVPVGDGGGEEVGLRDDRRVGVGTGDDEHVALGQGAGERDRLAGGGRAVAVELQRVPAGGEVDRGTGAV